LLLPKSVSALLAEFPDEMAETVAEAAERCRKEGGTPDVAKVLQSDDLNGDGRPDWVADFSKLICKDGSNPACGANGCLVQLYYWDGDDWDKVFEDFVKDHKFSTSGQSRLMHVTTYGAPCNRPQTETCSYTYKLEEDAITPVR
jgi:hypothetical protein